MSCKDLLKNDKKASRFSSFLRKTEVAIAGGVVLFGALGTSGCSDTVKESKIENFGVKSPGSALRVATFYNAEINLNPKSMSMLKNMLGESRKLAGMVPFSFEVDQFTCDVDAFLDIERAHHIRKGLTYEELKEYRGLYHVLLEERNSIAQNGAEMEEAGANDASLNKKVAAAQLYKVLWLFDGAFGFTKEQAQDLERINKNKS